MFVQKTHPFVVIFFLNRKHWNRHNIFFDLFESALQVCYLLRVHKRHKNAYYMTDLFQCQRFKILYTNYKMKKIIPAEKLTTKEKNMTSACLLLVFIFSTNIIFFRSHSWVNCAKFLVLFLVIKVNRFCYSQGWYILVFPLPKPNL